MWLMKFSMKTKEDCYIWTDSRLRKDVKRWFLSTISSAKLLILMSIFMRSWNSFFLQQAKLEKQNFEPDFQYWTSKYSGKSGDFTVSVSLCALIRWLCIHIPLQCPSVPGRQLRSWTYSIVKKSHYGTDSNCKAASHPLTTGITLEISGNRSVSGKGVTCSGISPFGKFRPEILINHRYCGNPPE